MGRKLGVCLFSGGGPGSPSNALWPGPRPTCEPSFIWIRPTVLASVRTLQTGQERTGQNRTGQDSTDSRQTDNGPLGYGEPFYKWSPAQKGFAVCYLTVVCPVLSVCNVGELRPNCWMDEAETWRGCRHRSRPHYVRSGPISRPQMGNTSRNFWPICCGQTAGCIKMPFGTEVGHIVLDEDPALLPHPEKGVQQPPPHFSAHVLWPNSRMDQEFKMPLGTVLGIGHDHIVLDGDPSPTPERGTAAPLIFGPCLVAKRLDESRCHLRR